MKRIALIGMPNAGKSTLFNRMSGASAKVANWPGVTVDLLSAKLLLAGNMAELVDLPGIYDLHGFSDDEQIVRHFLCNNTVDLVIIVANATQIDRQLTLALQLKSLGLPAVLLLNMADEAKQLGISIDTQHLGDELGYPTVLLSAKYGQGYHDAYQLIESELQKSQAMPTLSLEQDFAVDQEVEDKLDNIIRHSVDVPIQTSHSVTERIDNIMLNKWLGLPLFFTIMYLMFEAVYTIGAPLQDGVAWLLEGFRDLVLAPLLSALPPLLNSFLLEGVFDGVATVASFVPIVIVFFLFMAIIEDSGYLSRAAFLMDALMTRLGLDGRSFVMLLMGFGCNVPALMGTRTMRSRGLRLLTMLVIPFSLCSARLQVFVFMTTALFSPSQAPLVLFSLYMMTFAVVILTALLFKGQFNSSEPFALELPPYRFPTSRQMMLRGWHEIRHFLRRATKFITIGVVLVWILTNMPFGVEPASSASWSGWIGEFMSPILSPAGINPELTIALIFGFVAKEIVIGALAVIYGMEGSALMQGMAQQIDWVQAYSFMLFTLIYTPCLATIATLRSEAKSAWYTALSLAWPLTLAWCISTGFYQAARYLGY
ncbi:MAG: ferrous iron transport protein B [Gammaproteobacteria bacterium]|nr:MAG: ferrous iron transport protein B [Gammaproteobacteria bacterium]